MRASLEGMSAENSDRHKRLTYFIEFTFISKLFESVNLKTVDDNKVVFDFTYHNGPT